MKIGIAEELRIVIGKAAGIDFARRRCYVVPTKKKTFVNSPVTG
jgi:hypothetical protein